MSTYYFLLLILVPIANGYIFDRSISQKVLIVPKYKNGWHDSATIAPIDPLQIGTKDWNDLTVVERYYLETKGSLRFSGSSAYDYRNQELKDDYDASDYIDEEEHDAEEGSGEVDEDIDVSSEEDEDSEYEDYQEDDLDEYDNQYEYDNY